MWTLSTYYPNTLPLSTMHFVVTGATYSTTAGATYSTTAATAAACWIQTYPSRWDQRPAPTALCGSSVLLSWHSVCVKKCPSCMQETAWAVPFCLGVARTTLLITNELCCILMLIIIFAAWIFGNYLRRFFTLWTFYGMKLNLPKLMHRSWNAFRSAVKFDLIQCSVCLFGGVRVIKFKHCILLCCCRRTNFSVSAAALHFFPYPPLTSYRRVSYSATTCCEMR